MKELDGITCVDDLAGYWTEPTLHALKRAGVGHVSVDVEIATWRALRAAFMKELGRNQGQGAPLREMAHG